MVQDSLICLLVVDPIAYILCSLASWMRLCSFNVQILFLSFALNHGRSHWFKSSTAYHVYRGVAVSAVTPFSLSATLLLSVTLKMAFSRRQSALKRLSLRFCKLHLLRTREDLCGCRALHIASSSISMRYIASDSSRPFQYDPKLSHKTNRKSGPVFARQVMVGNDTGL